MAPSSPGAVHDSCTLDAVTVPVVRFVTASGGVRSGAGEVTFMELCGQFGVSRKTGYKWVLPSSPTAGRDWETEAGLRVVIRMRPHAP